jgi:hypothetical protein
MIDQNVNSIINHDFGEFFKCGNGNIRKQMVLSYLYSDFSQATNTPTKHAVTFIISGSFGPVNIFFDSKETADLEIEKIDWIFKKDRK